MLEQTQLSYLYYDYIKSTLNIDDLTEISNKGQINKKINTPKTATENRPKGDFAVLCGPHNEAWGFEIKLEPISWTG